MYESDDDDRRDAPEDHYEPEPRCPVCGAEDSCDIGCDCLLCVRRKARKAAQATTAATGDGMTLDDVIAVILSAFLVVVLLSGVGFVAYARYHECRAHGFSTFYCVAR